jgi:NAD+ kinase
MSEPRIAFTASASPKAQKALQDIQSRYEHVDVNEADIVVAIGGDGLMLRTLHATLDRSTPVYGMNAGSIGFLMNHYEEDNLFERLAAAEEIVLHPLRMKAHVQDGSMVEALAINEVSLLVKSGLMKWFAMVYWSRPLPGRPPITCPPTGLSYPWMRTSCA